MQEIEGKKTEEKKKKHYEKPEIEIIYLDDVDIITTSGEAPHGEYETEILPIN